VTNHHENHAVGDEARWTAMAAGYERWAEPLTAQFARAALSLSDADVLRGYVASLDPGVWLDRAARTRRPGRAAELAAVARALDGLGLGGKAGEGYRRIRRRQVTCLDRTDRQQPCDADPRPPPEQWPPRLQPTQENHGKIPERTIG